MLGDRFVWMKLDQAPRLLLAGSVLAFPLPATILPLLRHAVATPRRIRSSLPSYSLILRFFHSHLFLCILIFLHFSCSDIILGSLPRSLLSHAAISPAPPSRSLAPEEPVGQARNRNPTKQTRLRIIAFTSLSHRISTA